MITQTDLDIQNISYTNKDFASIYPEQIDLVKTLTNKWDPETSNESDPGNVLLKLNAFMGDKNDYNIDKNILERFITSATQENSARDLYNMLGYNIDYYISATTYVGFSYVSLGESESDNTLDYYINKLNKTLTIKAFDTSFKTSEGLVYTLLEDLSINKSNKFDSGKLAIQGELKCLNLYNTTEDTTNIKIQLSNLDDNNRVYFPTKYVSQNGVFINKEVYSEVNSNAWRRVDNLNDIDLGEKVYMFGFDSDKQMPYLQFPSDISQLIKDGIEVWYVTTEGLNGTTGTNTITAFNSYKAVISGNNGTFELKDGNYSLFNTTALGAKDPETLNEAYNGFKKTIGTFNTLVSRRDYANAIYNLEDDNQNYVSAIQVGDDFTDINNSYTTLTRKSNGRYYYRKVSTGAEKNKIYLHGTQAINSDVTTTSLYDRTYQNLSNTDEINIETAIDEYKTLYHELELPGDNEINYIQNKYRLKMSISTVYKVSDTEQLDIVKNVRNALYNEFNARNIDFGEEIPYDLIIQTAQDSDTRIKAVYLEDPLITPYIRKGNNDFVSLDFSPTHSYSDSSPEFEIILDNVSAGRVELYKIDNTFNYDFNNYSNHSVEKVVKLDGKFTVDDNTEYTLKKNESIQVLQDSYITDTIFSAYTYYCYLGGTTINDGTLHELNANELYVQYTDSSDKFIIKPLPAGTIIKPVGFNLINSNTSVSSNNTPSKWFDPNNLTQNGVSQSQQPGYLPLYCLASTESIEIVKRNEVKLDDINQRIYWYVSPKATYDSGLKVSSDLTFPNVDSEGHYYYILEDGEYFIYPNSDMTSINILSSGTKIYYDNGTIPMPSDIDKKYSTSDIQSNFETLMETESLNTFENLFDWVVVNLGSNPITMVETTLTNAIEGENVIVPTELSNGGWNILNEGEEIVLEDITIPYNELSNLIYREVLFINGSALIPQPLYNGQEIDVYYKDSGTATTVSGVSDGSGNALMEIQFSDSIDGYNEIFVGSYVYDDTNDIWEYAYTSSVYYYSISSNPPSGAVDFYTWLKSNNITKNAYGEYVIPYDAITGGSKSFYIPIANADVSANVTYKYTIFDTANGKTTLITPDSSSYEITLTKTVGATGEQYFIVLVPKRVSLNTNIHSNIVTALTNELNDRNFYFLANINNLLKIENSDFGSGYWFLDKNNIYNPYTLCSIDFSKSTFNIVNTSKKW